MAKLVLQAYNEKYSELAHASTKAVKRWAELTGYEYTLSKIYGSENPLRGRYRLILGCLHQFDEVIWLDCDVLPVAPRAIAAPPSFELSTSVDFNGLCSGATVWKPGPFSTWMCKGIIVALPQNGTEDDQTVMKQIAGMPWASKMVGTIPESEIANPCSQLTSEPTLMHLWSSSDYDGVVRKAKEMSEAFLKANA